MTVNLGAGTIDHVVNCMGGPADTSRVAHRSMSWTIRLTAVELGVT